jgi:hypothetical protein
VRILIDACLPTRCRTWFPGHTVETVEFRGWKGVLNGALLARAIDAGFGDCRAIGGVMLSRL